MKSYKYSKNDDYIINIEEQKEIIDWVKKNYLRLKKNDFNRYFGLIENYEDIPKIIYDIKMRIVKKENLENSQEEPLYKDSIGYMFDGSQLHVHIDENVGKLIHTRFNVYVKLPEKGGYPVYNGKVLRLKERTYICCRAGIDPHFCQKVYGDRIILSFGFLLPIERVSNIIYDYDNEYTNNIEVIEKSLMCNLETTNLISVENYIDIDTTNLMDLTKIKVTEKINTDLLIEKLKYFKVECSKDGTSTEIIQNLLLNEIIENKKNKISEENIYVFHNVLIDNNIKKIIPNFINLPKNIKDIETLRISRFYMGYKNSGTFLHNHSSALNYLLRGKKLWLVYPYSLQNYSYNKLNNLLYDTKYLKNKEKNILEWFKINLLKIKEDIIDSKIFIQNEGDVIFLPNLYYHTVLNLDYCIGITYSYI